MKRRRLLAFPLQSCGISRTPEPPSYAVRVDSFPCPGAIPGKPHRIPKIKFEDQRLNSFAGLVVYQSLFCRISLKQQLAGCFHNLTVSPIFGHGVIVLVLIVHLLY